MYVGAMASERDRRGNERGARSATFCVDTGAMPVLAGLKVQSYVSPGLMGIAWSRRKPSHFGPRRGGDGDNEGVRMRDGIGPRKA